jgi:hypothetical protein
MVSRDVPATCAVCDTTICAADLNQAPLGRRRYTPAHVLCYRAWAEESRAVRQESETA